MPTESSATPLRVEVYRGVAGLSIVRDVRYLVLRKPLGMSFESTLFSGDELPSTRHVVAFWEQEAVACLSLLVPESEPSATAGLAIAREPNSSPERFPRNPQEHPSLLQSTRLVQLRGMAVLESWQGKGCGGRLLELVYGWAQDENWELWCNARSAAVPFYAKYGWVAEGDSFDIPNIGAHYVMRWRVAV